MFSPFPLVSCLPNGEAFDSTVQSGFGGENRASIEDHRWHFVTREIHQGLLSQSNSFIPFSIPPFGSSIFVSKFHLGLICSYFTHSIFTPFFRGILVVQFSVCDSVI